MHKQNNSLYYIMLIETKNTDTLTERPRSISEQAPKTKN